MVLQKRLDYGFNGYQVPSMPRASRSARRRNSLKKKFENNQMCAFELLATVAGKLLQERESSSASSNVSRRTQPAVARDVSKRETKVGEKQLKVEHCDQENCDDSAFVCNLGLQVHNQNIPSDAPHISDDSIITNPDCSDKFDCVEGSVIARSRNENGKLATEIVGGYPGLYKSYKRKIGGVDGQMGPEPQDISIAPNRTVSDPCTLGNPMNLDVKPPAKLHSDSSLKLLLRRDTFSCGSFSKGHDNVKVMSRSNDDNSSGYNQPSTPTLKTLRAPPRIGDRRIRKLLASRYWKVAPNLKDGELSNSNGDVKPIFRYKKSCYTRQRSHWNPTSTRKKHFEHTFVSTSNQGVESEVISGSSRERFKRNTFQTGVRTHGASGASSSVSGSEPSFQSKDSHVKLSVKSFSIPELFIEIPETATVGSLKRTVKEAVTAILGGGLCVGVLIQGKKVSDDNKTLLQTGMCEDNKLDSLGFELEPNRANVPPLCSEDPPFLLPCDSFLPQTSCPAVSAFNPGTFESSSNPPVTNTDLGNSSESNLGLVPTPSDVPVDKLAPDSRTLVAVPSTSAKALAVVPLHRKSGRPELVQRRIRRPFSVSEVEALVHAVEKLGTGRWRDVKLRAFDNAKHRTYVDLKDKWKTLVHTARISPQQRRGEPVPQELLDRVLSAHAYWSQEQSKPTD